MKPPAYIDFETEPIQQRPHYPPRPVGVAVWQDGEAPFYCTWGTPRAGSGVPYNPRLENVAQCKLTQLWCDPEQPLVFHNAKFDIEVGEAWCNLPIPHWTRIHDTQFLAYLNDPHARQLGLKPLAAELLGMPPEEKDELGLWVKANAKMLRELGPSTPVTKERAGAWIWAMPGPLVDPYAVGDVVRTRKLFEYLYPLILETGMGAAYDRERELMPILLENEQRGMRVDLERLEADVEAFDHFMTHTQDQLRIAMKAPELNFDADQDVAEALIRCGAVLEADMPRTAPTKAYPEGQWSVAKTALRPETFNGNFGYQVAQALGYRNRLKTALDTFMRPWRDQALENKSYITTSWNQTRSPEGGTRTGRPSTSNHNFLNLPKSFKGKDDGYEHPAFIDVPELPLCRIYILPDEGEVFLHRDYNGQELRVFAHGEQGALWQAYQENPRIDPHAWVKGFMEPIARRELPRTNVKILNFQSIYGGGVPALQAALRCTAEEAKMLKHTHDQALPGRRILVEEITRVIKRGQPIRTVGGRLFFAERPGLDGRDKLYKLINYWVQGSASDITKQAIIDWHANPAKRARFLVTVYDEINASSPPEEEKLQMSILREAMERPRISVPMLSDGKRGFAWGALEKCE